MTIKYYLAPGKVIGSQAEQKQDAGVTATETSAPFMINYLCHVPGKLSFTVTARPERSGTL